MHFIFPIVFYCIMSSAYGCTEKKMSFLVDSNHLENPSKLQDCGSNNLDKLVEQHLNNFQMFENGELNLGNLQEKLSEMLKDVAIQSILEGIPENDVNVRSECGIYGNDRLIEMPNHDISGTCS